MRLLKKINNSIENKIILLTRKNHRQFLTKRLSYFELCRTITELQLFITFFTLLLILIIIGLIVAIIL